MGASVLYETWEIKIVTTPYALRYMYMSREWSQWSRSSISSRECDIGLNAVRGTSHHLDFATFSASEYSLELCR